MKTKKLLKALGVVLAAVALVVVSVLGTMAWLTSTTDEVVNTITVGNVDLDLYETVTTPAEEEGGEPTVTEVKAQNYKLFPGQTYSKNPTVEVQRGSEECYIRVKVTVTNATAWDGQFNSCINLQEGWTCVNPNAEANADDEIEYEYRYATVINAAEADVAKAVFTTLTVPGTWNNTTITNDETITVVAHGIQATGMTDAADAWAKFDAAQ